MLRQHDLFDGVPLMSAQAAGTEAAEACLAKAQDVAGFDAEGAGKFTVETARLSINFPVPAGGDLRAWGEVTRRALKLGYIKHVPRTQAAASSNGAQKCMYEKGPKA